MAERRDHGGFFAFAKKEEAAEDDGAITIPEDLDDRDAHPDDELTSLEETLVSAFNELKDSGQLDTATIESMSELADGLDTVRGEMTRRQQADEDAAATIAELSNRVTAQAEDEEEGDGEEGAEEGDGEEGADEEALAETAPVDEPETEPAPQAVAASTK